MLSTTNIACTFDGNTTLRFPDIQCNSGEQMLLLGRSGSGKTTLLHIICGLLQPANGKVLLSGTDIYSLPPAVLDRFRGQHIGIIFQRPHLIKNLSVIQNVLLAQYLAGKKENKKEAKEILDILGLQNRQNAMPHTLSQGEAQRASIARAIVNKPALILADEPTSSLDDENSKNVITLLTSLAHDLKATLIIATHDKRVKSALSNCINLSETRP